MTGEFLMLSSPVSLLAVLCLEGGPTGTNVKRSCAFFEEMFLFFMSLNFAFGSSVASGGFWQVLTRIKERRDVSAAQTHLTRLLSTFSSRGRRA